MPFVIGKSAKLQREDIEYINTATPSNNTLSSITSNDKSNIIFLMHPDMETLITKELQIKLFLKNNKPFATIRSTIDFHIKLEIGLENIIYIKLVDRYKNDIDGFKSVSAYCDSMGCVEVFITCAITCYQYYHKPLEYFLLKVLYNDEIFYSNSFIIYSKMPKRESLNEIVNSTAISANANIEEIEIDIESMIDESINDDSIIFNLPVGLETQLPITIKTISPNEVDISQGPMPVTLNGNFSNDLKVFVYSDYVERFEAKIIFQREDTLTFVILPAWFNWFFSEWTCLIFLRHSITDELLCKQITTFKITNYVNLVNNVK